MAEYTLEKQEDHMVVRYPNGAGGCIPYEAIASWGVLLGTSSDAETVAAIVTARDPGVLDHATGRNAWTSAYEEVERQMASDLNQTQVVGLKRAMTYSRALTPDGRLETRRQLGLPTGDDGMARALSLMDEEGETPPATIPMPEGIDTTELEVLLSDAGVRTAIDNARDDFDKAIKRTILRK